MLTHWNEQVASIEFVGMVLEVPEHWLALKFSPSDFAGG